MKRKRLIYRSTILGALLIIILSFTIFQYLSEESNTPKSLIGKTFINFTGTTLNDYQVELKNVHDQKTIINFWASWCTPCKREMPTLEEVYKKNKKNGFTIVAVNIGESTLVVKQFTEQFHLTFPVIIDKQGEIQQHYNVYNLPASFLVNSSGVIEEVYEGELTKEILDNWLN